MCRLLGYAAPVATTAKDILGEDGCSEWQRLGRLHADGWGTSWLQNGQIERIRSAETGLRDPMLSHSLSDEPTRARIAHLRLATEGLARTIDNAHPFVTDRFTLAHNGSIRPVSLFLKLVTPEELERHGGNSDSAVLVALINRRLNAGKSLFDAVTSTVEFVAERFPGSAINLLVMSKDELIAVHANEGAPLPKDEFDAANLGDDLPIDHIEHYYRLSYKHDKFGTVAFTSSGIDRSDWTEMEQNTAAHVEFATQRLTFRPLRIQAHAAAA